MNIEEVVDELYRLPPAVFTAARDEQSKAARAAGDRGLAKAIGALRKPTAGAWLANLLVRTHAGQIEELLELGAAMREAQEALAGPELVSLSRQRHSVIAALAAEARRLAAATGSPVTGAAGVELEGTLTAALADDTAGTQLRSGRLTTALVPGSAGFGAGPEATTPAPPAIPVSKKRPPDRRAERRAVAEAELREAEREAEQAATIRAEAQAAARQQEEAELALRRRRSDVEAELGRVRADESLAARELARLHATRTAAETAATAAEKRLDRARVRRNRAD